MHVYAVYAVCGDMFLKISFSRAARTGRFSNKKDYVMTFVAKLIKRQFYTRKRTKSVKFDI